MYVPILRNREVEMKILKDLVGEISTQTIPYLEIVHEHHRSKHYSEVLSKIFKNTSIKFFLNFPRFKTIPDGVLPPIKEFLHTTKNSSNRKKEFLKCKEVLNFVPTLSYADGDIRLSKKQINADINDLKKSNFNSIGLKLTTQQLEIFEEIDDLSLSKDDFFFFDIGYSSHTKTTYERHYNNIAELQTKNNCTTLIMHCNRPRDFRNNQLLNAKKITDIDNSILKEYGTLSCEFDGFADYAGLNNELPLNGGGISPAGIFYSSLENTFYGFRKEGSRQNLNYFAQYIVPQILLSDCWNEFSDNHRSHCPGCKEILSFLNDPNKSRNQGKWKGITMAHYIKSIDEYLN